MTRYGTTPHDTDEIVALRQTINDNERAFSDLRTIHSDEQRRLSAEYDNLMAEQRPTYPTEDQLRGLAMIATNVREDISYGDHHGWPRDVDREAGRELPRAVHFSTTANRINIYALAPYRATSTQHTWVFTDDDIQAFRDELQQRSLRIVSEWTHEDGVAFQVFTQK